MAIKTKVLLRILKSAPMQDVQRRLIDIASQWTASGYVQQTNRLLVLAPETGDLSTFTIPLAAFEIPWSLTGTRPTTWPPSARDTDAIELDLWERLFGQKWTDATVDRVKSARPEELRGQSMLIRAVITAYDGSRSDRVAAADRLAEAAALLDRFLGSNSPDAVGYTLFQALTCRVILAARLGDDVGQVLQYVSSELGCLVPPDGSRNRDDPFVWDPRIRLADHPSTMRR